MTHSISPIKLSQSIVLSGGLNSSFDHSYSRLKLNKSGKDTN